MWLVRTSVAMQPFLSSPRQQPRKQRITDVRYLARWAAGNMRSRVPLSEKSFLVLELAKTPEKAKRIRHNPYSHTVLEPMPATVRACATQRERYYCKSKTRQTLVTHTTKLCLLDALQASQTAKCRHRLLRHFRNNLLALDLPLAAVVLRIIQVFIT